MNNTFNNIRQYLKNKLNNYLDEVKVIYSEQWGDNPKTQGCYNYAGDLIRCKNDIFGRFRRHVLLHERFHATGRFDRLGRFSPNSINWFSQHIAIKEYSLFRNININRLETEKNVSIKSLYDIIEEAVVERAICLYRGKLVYDFNFRFILKGFTSYKAYYEAIINNEGKLTNVEAELIIENIEKEAKKIVSYHRKALFLSFLRKVCYSFYLV